MIIIETFERGGSPRIASRKRDQDRHLMMTHRHIAHIATRVVLAAPRSATAPLARIRNTVLQARHRLQPSSHRRDDRNDLLSHRIGARSTLRDRRPAARTAAPRRSNPHSARGTAARSPTRFPPLEAFGRRPSARAAPSDHGPASETLQKADIAARWRDVRFTPTKADIESLGSNVR